MKNSKNSKYLTICYRNLVTNQRDIFAMQLDFYLNIIRFIDLYAFLYTKIKENQGDVILAQKNVKSHGDKNFNKLEANHKITKSVQKHKDNT